MSTLVARANTGSGTDQLAGFTTPDGFAGAVVPVDASGNAVSIATSAKQDAGNTSLSNIDGKLPALSGGKVPVTDPSSLPLPTGAATEASLTAINGKLPALATHNPLHNAPAIPVRMPDIEQWTCSFANSGASFLSSDFTLLTSGTGVSYNQTSGSLNVVAGTTTNAEWLARSSISFDGSLIFRASVVASQRIVNNNLLVMLADMVGDNLSCTINSATQITVTKTAHGFTSANAGQFMMVGGITGAAGVPGRYALASVPDANTLVFTVAGWPASGSCTVDLFGWSHIKVAYNGATATSALFDAQRRGWASGDTTVTFNTSATPGHIFQVSQNGRDLFLLDALRASAVTPVYATRASRYENIPDDDVPLYVYIWSYNGTTAPASSTTWTIGFVSVEDFTNLPVYLAGNRAQGSNQALPVAIPAGVVVNSGTVTTVSTVTGVTTVSAVTSANLGIPGAIADVASAALTTTTTTAAFTPTFGLSYVVHIPITVVSGTSPTLDVGVEESPDGSTNWVRVYDFPRMTAVGSYTSPPLPFTGNRVRYVQTVGGTTPSFTRAINRLQLSSPASMLRRQTMLNAQTTTGQGLWYTDRGALPTFAANVAGTGAVSATIRIWGRNISGAGAVLLGTIGLSGTTSAADSGVTDYRYIEYMAEVTAISGTGAAVTVVMAS